MNETEQRKEAIFEAALQLPAGLRDAHLNQACAGDAGLRQRVEVLLGAFERAGSFMKQSATPERTARIPLPPTEKSGDRIGRYKLLEQIGEGGCGVVYVAEQEKPVRRRVALKVIKLGMDTKQVITRFDAERQALAMMDHPNIAKIFDAGVCGERSEDRSQRSEGATGNPLTSDLRPLTSGSDRPYFVMELVRGIKITDYCDQNHLSPRERLDLFIQVCRAIQHAHQKGVIHRDIKPSNILVTVNDGVPVPKVIDFGIAKATQGRLTDQTIYTAFEQFIGTPAYMSPEQAAMTSLDIDTRSDIYSLGVLLYELLTGKTPFDAKELLAGGLDEMRRTIREVEPIKPSTRLTHDLVAAGVRRRTGKTEIRNPKSESASSRRLLQEVRGDLDWIVMKCLEKDRTRRYETANGLATDLNRHLNNEPIVARPPSSLYRFQKAVRRNTLAFGAGAAVVGALAVGLCVASWGLLRERSARRQAESARNEARTESARSQQVAQFLKDTLRAAGPAVARGRDVTLLREVLEQTAKRIGRDLTNQPEVRGDLWFTLGAVYSDMADLPRAITNFQQSVDSYREAFAEPNAKLAKSLGRLGKCQSFTGDVARGKANAQAGVEMARKLGNPDTLATCLVNLAVSYSTWGMGSTEAVPHLREALALRQRLGGDPMALADCMSWLATSLPPTNAAEAESLSREVLELSRKHLEPDHPNIASGLFSLGQKLLQSGELEEAETTLREAYDRYRKVHDASHPYQPIVLRYFDRALILRGKGDEALAITRQATETWPTNGLYWALLGAVNASLGDWPAAVAPLSRAVQLKSTDEADHWLHLAVALLRSGEKQEYQRHCHAFLERFPWSQAAEACLLLPVEKDDLERACQLADAGVQQSSAKLTDPWAGFIKALADLRREKFESARNWTERAIAADCDCQQPSEAAAWFVQGLACARLRQMDSARAAFAKGEALIRQHHTNLKLDLHVGWRNWGIAELLHAEARFALASARSN